MNIKLMIATIAITGLAACSPDITPQASTAPSAPVANSAPAQPAAGLQIAKAEQAAATPAAQEERKFEYVAPADDEIEHQVSEKKAN
ncbi:MAG: hypothetical protein JJE42_02860 [Burkholderiales bacterium]|nr:hypothetical protein [Burkholderiales bacterium]